MYEDIYIYRTTVATSCDLNAPRCTTEGVFVGHRPPRDPSDPPHYDIFIGSFTSIQTCHTHTPCLWQGGAMENEVKMRMKGGMKVRWTWKWSERLLNKNAKRGTQKKREREYIPTHLARSGQTLKGQGKRKAEGRRARNKTSGGGGKTEAPEPTWHGENLHKPQHATGPTYLGREERMK